MLAAKRDEAQLAVACLVTAYRFSKVPATTRQVYVQLAANDDDAKVRGAMEEAVKQIDRLQ